MPFSKHPTPAKVVGSPQQEAIWTSLRKDESHIVVKALAGTGKTFTMIEGLKRVNPGLRSCFVAFNKSIADELSTKVPSHAQACTLHSLGNKALYAAGFKPKLDRDKTFQIIEQIAGKMPWSRKQALTKLVGYVKNTLADTDTESLLDIAFQLDLLDRLNDECYPMVGMILDECKKLTAKIDFDDMIWLPVVLGLPVPKYDLLMVDEAQDLNKTQQALALSAGDRICIVGDSHQAIYGFRGSDVNSIPNLEAELAKTPRGVQSFPLTVSRRCPQVVTKLAQRIVPQFECLSEAPEGSYTAVPSLSEAKYGDMVLCRVNAPLVSHAYRLLRSNVRAKIQGRDIGEGLRLLVTRLAKDSNDTKDLLEALSDYQSTEELRIISAYKFGTESKLAVLGDRCDCVRALCDGIEDVATVKSRIQELFEDVGTDHSKVVLLSSVHRAKGLEANRVFILAPEKLPHPMAKQPWEKEQELNLAYVAVTRTRDELFFVHEDPSFIPPAFFAGNPNYGITNQEDQDQDSIQDIEDETAEESEGALCELRSTESKEDSVLPKVQPKAQRVSKTKKAPTKKGEGRGRTSKA